MAQSPFELYKEVLRAERAQASKQWKWCHDDGEHQSGWWCKDANGNWQHYGEGQDEDYHDEATDDNEGNSGNNEHSGGARAWIDTTKAHKSQEVDTLRTIYEHRWHTLQTLKRCGERWGNPTYDTAWRLYEQARVNYNEAKPPIPRAQKLALLHSDIAKAQEALEKAKERVSEAQETLRQEEERLERATEKLEKQKQRMAEYNGEEMDPSWCGGIDTVAPFATSAKNTIDECGNLLYKIAADMEEGEADACKANLETIFNMLGGVRDEAQAIEEAKGKHNEEQGEWDAYSIHGSEEEQWEQDWWPSDDHDTGKEGTNKDDQATSVTHQGETWVATNTREEGAVWWRDRYWRKAALEKTAQPEKVPQERTADSSGELETSTQAGNKGPRDEDMPQAIGQQDPNKKQRVDAEEAKSG